eukprot:6940643-Prymnesium_polylepis.1
MKTLATICELNHFSLDVVEGRKFKPFSCRCGWHSGDEKTWRAAVEAHAQLNEEERKAADLEHSANPLHLRHKPLDPPLAEQDAIDNSADVLHLVFINMFAFFMEHTMLITLNEWQPAARAPFEAYLHRIGIPMKIVKALNVTEMRQSMTGRDAKVLTAGAHKHIPELLAFVHAGEEAAIAAVEATEAEAEAEAAAAAATSAKRPRRAVADEDDFDLSEEEEEEAEEEDTSDDALTRYERDARAWDIFLKLVRAMLPFERNDDEYCEARAIETFNAAGAVMKEWRRLSPSAQSSCPHVALCVLPRQQKVHGDHERRGADHGEAYGASIKDSIHRRCLRR